ncbi:hypothetical protein N8940_01960 [Sphingomonadaceae bacterium]|nr:hypothetical protein [Sphingomonadaceae bacterium]
MELIATRNAKLTAIALVVVALTQVAYITLKGDTITGTMIWTVEAFAFLAIAVLPLTVIGRSTAPLAWGALSLFGVFNVVQAGMGLTMFAPLDNAGEAMAAAKAAVLAFAFFMYFSGKMMLGLAAIIIGLGLFKTGGGLAKAVGGLAAVAGLAAFLGNGAGIIHGIEAVRIAGATGTVAALFAAIAIFMIPRSDAA